MRQRRRTRSQATMPPAESRGAGMPRLNHERVGAVLRRRLGRRAAAGETPRAQPSPNNNNVQLPISTTPSCLGFRLTRPCLGSIGNAISRRFPLQVEVEVTRHASVSPCHPVTLSQRHRSDVLRAPGRRNPSRYSRVHMAVAFGRVGEDLALGIERSDRGPSRSGTSSGRRRCRANAGPCAGAS